MPESFNGKPMALAGKEHRKRCRDPFVCIDDTGPEHTWKGCGYRITRAALEAARRVGDGNE